MTWRMPLMLVLGLGLASCGRLTAGDPFASPAPKPPESDQPFARPPVPKAKPPDKPAAGPEELLGQDEGAVRKTLGDPYEVRSEGAAHILAYRGENDCTLDLIFFLDVKSGDLRLLSYQLDKGPSRPSSARSCYAGIRSGR